VANLADSLQDGIATLIDAESQQHEESHTHANFIRDTLLPAMLVVRVVSDQLEQLIPDDIWPLPTYTDMLFVR